MKDYFCTLMGKSIQFVVRCILGWLASSEYLLYCLGIAVMFPTISVYACVHISRGERKGQMSVIHLDVPLLPIEI